MGGMRMAMRIATPQVQGGVVTAGGQYINQGIRQPITMTPQGVNLPPRYGTPNFDQSGNMVQVQRELKSGEHCTIVILFIFANTPCLCYK